MNELKTLESFQELFPARDADAPPLVTKDLGVRFGGLVALRDVSFTLRRNETVSIIGQNGAGKSTLLNALSGLVPSTPASRIHLDGLDLSQKSAWQRGLRGFGRGFQDPPLIDEISVRDNLLVGAHRLFQGTVFSRLFSPRAIRREEDLLRTRADLLLSIIGLGDRADSQAGELPYGLRKLVDIARSLMGSPSVLLLDEPTSGLDTTEQEVVKDLLSLIRKAERITVLMVEHHMTLVQEVSDRVLVIDAGSIASFTTPTEALGLAASTEELGPEERTMS